MIGTLLPDRMTCGTVHLPGCYNPHSDDTYCICGAQRWPGRVGVIISAPRHEPAPAPPPGGIGLGGVGYREPPRMMLGWDTYQLHADHCQLRAAEDGHLTWHVCQDETLFPVEDEPLFPGFESPAGAEPLSPDRRRTQRQHDDVARGVHPLMRTPLHPEAPKDAAPTDSRRRPFTCGECVHRIGSGPHGYPKCDVGPISHSAATDVRAWWPACPSFTEAAE